MLLLLINGVMVQKVIATTFPEFTYNGFTGRNLLLDGAASVGEDGILTLTNGTTGVQQQGRCFYPYPIHLQYAGGQSRSFTSTFVFAIACSGSGCGDGMTFVISSAADFRAASSPAYLGLADPHDALSNPLVAVELDTVADPELMDRNGNHVGVDVNSLTSNLSRPAGYIYRDDGAATNFSFQALNLSSGDPMQLWVNYDAETTQLDVTLALVPMFKPSTPLFSYNVSLARLLVTGDSPMTKAYFGFTASTGESGGTSHQVLGWSFGLGGSPLNYTLLPLKRAHQDQGGGGGRARGDRRSFIAWLSAAASVLAVLSAVAAGLAIRWWKRRAGRRENWEAELELGPRRFAYRDLRRATDGFTRLLGKGGFGRVYGGVLASDMPVAVKRVSPDSRQGMAQFTAELIILGGLRHRNLVRLLGYCRHKEELLLVYEHMPNGSLDRYLHGGQYTTRPLVWSQRLHVVKCVAAGLLYLHDDWEQVIVHRDVKASNVLLDAEMNGRLGDFGLARLHDHGAEALHTTHVAGTRGYLAPELLRFRKATKATDVFAFGAFVLEVACGRRPVGLNARGVLLVLVEWVRHIWSSGGSVVDAMDPRLEDYAADEAELVVKLGLLCSHPLPVARPGMRLVMQYLDGDLPLPEFSPDYLCITDVDQVLIDESSSSVATTITGHGPFHLFSWAEAEFHAQWASPGRGALHSNQPLLPFSCRVRASPWTESMVQVHCGLGQ
uniref:Protein kinase domain-containing protein n=1 Tax=Oryza brachyantha TaxID=4533 RepID=J3MIE5_ORYBR